MIKTGFIKAFGIDYRGTLPKIRKSEKKLQPVFEALTNSLEALSIKGQQAENQKITIRVFFVKDLFSEEDKKCNFIAFQIEDNGIGFNDKEFERAIALNDNRKGFSNKGTGRVQFIHFFNKTKITSIFQDEVSSTKYYKRVLEMSKMITFLNENSIINHISTEQISADETSTTLTLTEPINNNDLKYYSQLNIDDLKSEILNQFLIYFCDNRKKLPKIKLEFWRDNELEEERQILENDIPKINYETNISIPYREVTSDGKDTKISHLESEVFNLKTFNIEATELSNKEILLTSKGQKATSLKLKCLASSDKINNKRYLFLLSGEYIDSKDSDTRGNIKIPTIEEFRKNSNELFSTKAIVIEDLENQTNKVIEDYYSEIKKKNQDKHRNIEKLKNMFLLNEETLNGLNINLNETDDQILKKVYESDIKIIAKRDAEIKNQIEKIEKLDTSSEDYKVELEESIIRLVKTIPLQNRSALTHYVARRKLVLDLFDKILNKQLDILKEGGRIDENIMHNLIFQQSSDNPSDSDLWIINEEFIYFNGFSEYKLKNVEVNGKKLFSSEFTKEEEAFLNSLGKRRLDRRPDILLFPEDGKCVIIELKAPDIDVSDHLSQINKYASLIRNYTNTDFQITRFYGFLLGENIEAKDVLGAVSSFEISPNFNYLYQPSQKVIDFSGKLNGSIYTEVIKYSTLLKRAKLRNKVFIDKLLE